MSKCITQLLKSSFDDMNPQKVSLFPTTTGQYTCLSNVWSVVVVKRVNLSVSCQLEAEAQEHMAELTNHSLDVSFNLAEKRGQNARNEVF